MHILRQFHRVELAILLSVFRAPHDQITEFPEIWSSAIHDPKPVPPRRVLILAPITHCHQMPPDHLQLNINHPDSLLNRSAVRAPHPSRAPRWHDAPDRKVRRNKAHLQSAHHHKVRKAIHRRNVRQAYLSARLQSRPADLNAKFAPLTADVFAQADRVASSIRVLSPTVIA